MRSIISAFICLCCLFESNAQSMRVQMEDCKLTNEEYNDLRRSMFFQQNFFKVVFKDSVGKEVGAKVLADERAYLKYSKRELDYNPNKHNYAAYFTHKENQIVIHKELENFVFVFRHELSHGLYFMYCRQEPTWLSEGVAELLEDIQLNATGKYEFDLLAYSKKYAMMNRAMEDHESVEILRDENFRSEEYAYTMAWGVVNFLYRTNPEFLFEIMRESCDLSYYSINSLYPGGEPALEADLYTFYLMNAN